MSRKPVYSITPFTLLDYPGKTACILWFAGCNMRCPYCYNPDIVQANNGKIPQEETMQFLRSRRGLLDGVVLSGGECTRFAGLESFIKDIKELGMLVKIDTNGSNPALLSSLAGRGLIDYAALDFKSPPALFRMVTSSKLYSKFEKSLDVLISSGLPFEVRTTWHSELLSTEDIYSMVSFVRSKGYQGTYYIQNALNDVPVLGTTGRSAALRMSGQLQADLNIVIRN